MSSHQPNQDAAVAALVESGKLLARLDALSVSAKRLCDIGVEEKANLLCSQIRELRYNLHDNLSDAELLKVLQEQIDSISILQADLDAEHASAKLAYQVAQNAAFQTACERLKAIIVEHKEVLVRVKGQTSFTDHFGLVNRKKWNREVHKFIAGIVEPSLGFLLTPALEGFAVNLIDQLASNNDSNSSPLVAPDVAAMSAVSYEAYCANELRQLGWDAQLTPATGDQGADIIAMRGGIRVVIQCKKYSSPVGNDAVQQVIAAMAFQDAKIAAVVSNAMFTPAARQLAKKANVLLLHHSELGLLDGS